MYEIEVWPDLIRSADTENYFNVIHDPIEAETTFAFIDDHPNVALVTINDDVTSYPEKTDQAMRKWFDERWPTPAEWENPSLVRAPEPEMQRGRFRHRKL